MSLNYLIITAIDVRVQKLYISFYFLLRDKNIVFSTSLEIQLITKSTKHNLVISSNYNNPWLRNLEQLKFFNYIESLQYPGRYQLFKFYFCNIKHVDKNYSFTTFSTIALKNERKVHKIIRTCTWEIKLRITLSLTTSLLHLLYYKHFILTNFSRPNDLFIRFDVYVYIKTNTESWRLRHRCIGTFNSCFDLKNNILFRINLILCSLFHTVTLVIM